MLYISSKQAPKQISRRCVGSRLLWLMVTVILMSSCSTPFDVKAANQVKMLQPHLAEKDYTSFDGDPLGYQKWVSAKVTPKTVIIGVHGISGYSGDYQNLGEFLLKSHPHMAFYAPETRGQGMDREVQRRGDIRRAKDWYRDLYTFTGLVRKVHPKAKIVWFGESMGSLIVLHAYQENLPAVKKPDAVVLSSPIVGVNEKLPPWKYSASRAAAVLFPKLRVSLETLSDGQRPVVTEDDIHEQQAAKNPWYISQYTLRLLLTLSRMSENVNEAAATIQCPVLVLHGGKDIFTSEARVKDFYAAFPETTDKTRKFYPESYHLLMYDHDRENIFEDISKWLHRPSLSKP